MKTRLWAAALILCGCSPGSEERPEPYGFELPAYDVQVRCEGAEASKFVVPESVVLEWSGPDYRGALPFQFVNGGDRTMEFGLTLGKLQYTLEKQVEGSWKAGWAPIMQMPLEVPLEVCAGGSLQGTLWVWGTTQPQVHQNLRTDPYAGEYRLRFFAQYTEGNQEVPTSVIASPSFWIE